MTRGIFSNHVYDYVIDGNGIKVFGAAVSHVLDVGWYSHSKPDFWRLERDSLGRRASLLAYYWMVLFTDVMMGRTWSACTAYRWIHKHVKSVEEGPCLINIQPVKPTLTAPLHQTITPINHHNTSSYSSYHFENNNPSSKSTQTPQVQVPNPPRKAKLQKKNAFHKRQQPHHLRVRTPIPSSNSHPQSHFTPQHMSQVTASLSAQNLHLLLVPQTLKPSLPPHRTSTLGNGVGGVAKQPAVWSAQLVVAWGRR